MKAGLSFGLFFFFIQSICAIGLGEWTYTTELGTYFDAHDGPTIINCKDQKIERARTWYFYKNRIIGNCGTHNRIESYFILNEKTCELQEFNNQKLWEQSISKNGLVPKVWTRWFITHVRIKLFVLGSVFLYFWFISIPLLILTIWITISTLKTIMSKLGQPTYYAWLIFLTMISAFIFIENTIQSI